MSGLSALRGGDAVRLSTPFEEWPTADRSGWQAAVRKRGPLDEQAAAASWRPTTTAGVRASYSCWLRRLLRRSPGSLVLEPRDRVTRAAVGDYIAELRLSVSDGGVATYLAQVAMAVKAISPGADFPWLRSVVARPRRSGTSGKKSGRLVDSRKLMKLGISMMEEARARREGLPRHRATSYRNGLMIALLALRPLRLANFIGTEIGSHLAERGGKQWISFTAAETKNKRAIDFPFPTNLLRHLKHYLVHVRPFLCEQTSGRNSKKPFRPFGDRLWVSGTDSALQSKAFFTMAVRLTTQAFGRQVNPHLFRDCLVTTLSSEDADLASVIPYVLGHKAIRTSENHYNHALGRRETERFQRHVQALRSSGKTNLS
jgi:integrase/recombinase XerD